MTDWFVEALIPEVALRLRIDRVIYRGRTEFQQVLVFENPMLGRVLALDDICQTTERDEYFYHEMIAHTPILAHGEVRAVLVVGGGDGGTLRRCLQHPVERVTLVELDRQVIELCKIHLPALGAGAFEDPRTELVIGDGSEFVARSSDAYDVIIVDSTDPVGGPGDVLFSEGFYADCKRRLRPGGILVNQSGNPFLEPDTLGNAARRLRRSFADVGCFVGSVPSYAGGYMAFGWASDDPALRRVPTERLASRFAAAGLDTRCYTPDLHAAAFALPRMIGDLVA